MQMPSSIYKVGKYPGECFTECFVIHRKAYRLKKRAQHTSNMRYANPNILPRELYSDEIKTGDKFNIL